jgi:hypothetical protein
MLVIWHDGAFKKLTIRIPDLALPASHPKRAFMRRVVELEIRLAYHDRILETLPEPMQSAEAGVICAQPPDPVWPYENQGKLIGWPCT